MSDPVHMDSYVSPTSWDDLGMDWSDPDAQDARYVDALVCALRERYKALGTTWAGPAIRPDMILSYDKLMTIHNATLGLIPQYLNMTEPIKQGIIKKTASGTYYSGDYEYHYCALNYWTHKDCLSSIGDSVLLSPQSGGLSNNNWLIQQKKLINTLTLARRGIGKFIASVYKREKATWTRDGQEYNRDTTTGPLDNRSDRVGYASYDEDDYHVAVTQTMEYGTYSYYIHSFVPSKIVGYRQYWGTPYKQKGWYLHPMIHVWIPLAGGI